MTRAMIRAVAIASAIAALAPRTRAEPKYVIRMAAIAPDGTGWAREVRAFARDVEAETDGEVRIKWYMGGIAGNEVEVIDRIKRGQVDGAASAGPLCAKVSPSWRVFAIVGLFQSRDELHYVQQALRPRLADEFRRSGFEPLAFGSLGPHVILSSRRVTTLAEARKQKLFIWDLDDVGVAMSRAMGLDVVPLPLEQAARAYDDHRLDGFISIPSATLGFQWYTRAHFMLNLQLEFVTGCIAITSRAYDRLPAEDQRALLGAAAKLAERIDVVTRAQDDQLLGGIFERQGVVPQAASEQLRAEFLTAARAARDQLGERLAPVELIQKVLALLADYRLEHR